MSSPPSNSAADFASSSASNSTSGSTSAASSTSGSTSASNSASASSSTGGPAAGEKRTGSSDGQRATVDTHAEPTRQPGETEKRLPVAKTYQLYLGGTFTRSESGRVYPVTDHRGIFVAHAAQASRKDVRDAVVAARSAFPGWAGTPAYHRGETLYRIAEMLEGRREQFAAALASAEGWPAKRAAALVDLTVDRWVWYAGWADKVVTILGTANPVAGPYFCVSVPEPTGVVGVLAPRSSALLGLVSVLAPVIATGNTTVVVASQNRPLPAVTLSEVLATSDLPGGVVNVLTGRTAELAPWLAAHADVNALDLCGAPAAISADLERTAAGTVKRVVPAPATEPDWTRTPDIRRLRAFVETKTLWHPCE